MSSITKEKEKWMLTVAWKKMTLQQIAVELNINVTIIHGIYRKHGITPMTKRDLIASKVIDHYNSDSENLTTHEYAAMLECTPALIKEIATDYNLNIPSKKSAMAKTVSFTNKQKNAKAMSDYLAQERKIKIDRAAFALYTQSGSELTDSVRQINTTMRPKTYLTNGNV